MLTPGRPSSVRAFACPVCSHLVFFENSACLNCGAALALRWADRQLVALEPPCRRCANASLAACNAQVDREGDLCEACALTRTRPSDADPEGLAALVPAEAAKRRLFFELGELGLPTAGLEFDLLSSTHEPVTTGHADGLVTLDLAESDDARREKRRIELGEPYRTLLGHLRHEVGHFYFPILVGGGEDSGALLARARALFGDESLDYQEALDRHYNEGPPADWAERHVSAYATMHPAEDWAETFAHFLHIWDVVQTAEAYRVTVQGPPGIADREQVTAIPRVNRGELRSLLADWLPLSYALNAMNRSMGREDLYPFVLPEPVIGKLEFVFERVLGDR